MEKCNDDLSERERGDSAPDPSYYNVADGNGQATTASEAGDDLSGDARPTADRRHPFSARLNQILDKEDFDGYVEARCQRFYADEIGRPDLPPRCCFRLLLIGYFEYAVLRLSYQIYAVPRSPRFIWGDANMTLEVTTALLDGIGEMYRASAGGRERGRPAGRRSVSLVTRAVGARSRWGCSRPGPAKSASHVQRRLAPKSARLAKALACALRASADKERAAKRAECSELGGVQRSLKTDLANEAERAAKSERSVVS